MKYEFLDYTGEDFYVSNILDDRYLLTIVTNTGAKIPIYRSDSLPEIQALATLVATAMRREKCFVIGHDLYVAQRVD